ncbi:MAG: AAA family ATPase [Bacteroidia bacterium]|nr:AAA family ATPase [Bacteroidia bacterium]
MTAKSPTQIFINAVTGALPFVPNSDQKLAIEKITEFIFTNDERGVFILKGYAGTGKTNLISAVTKALPTVRWRSVLLAPTGRAAKVLSLYAQRPAQTIHKKIFRKEMGTDGSIHFSLGENLHRNTLFLVDEASMIGADQGGESLFNSLLENLFEYVYSGTNCKLVLIGDTAQLPPVGCTESPALNPEYLKGAFYLNIRFFELKEVARQRLESGILLNARLLRNSLFEEEFVLPKITCTKDVVNLNGMELEDTLNSAISEFGEDNVIIITRSNKRAGLFNQSYRNRIRLFEEDLCTGDKLMIVKNNYFWLPENNGEAGFVANGDMAEITRILRREEMYGFNFCDCVIRFNDYPNLPEQEVKLITDSLFTDNPALPQADQKKLYEAVMADVSEEPIRAIRSAYLKKSPYYNALQVKFSYAVTCHKSQGGQWPVVFIDQGYLKDEDMNPEFIRWLYTALTRAREKVFLINFSEILLEN